MKENLIYDKTFKFAVKIMNLYKYLSMEQKEYIISKQVLRAGTSIGANVREALQAQSKKDFLFKMNIALKESAETEYWIELLIATNYVTEKSILNECKEINRIITSIVKTTKTNLSQI